MPGNSIDLFRNHLVSGLDKMLRLALGLNSKVDSCTADDVILFFFFFFFFIEKDILFYF